MERGRASRWPAWIWSTMSARKKCALARAEGWHPYASCFANWVGEGFDVKAMLAPCRRKVLKNGAAGCAVGGSWTSSCRPLVVKHKDIKEVCCKLSFNVMASLPKSSGSVSVMIVVGDGLRCGVVLNAGILSRITLCATGIVSGLALPVRRRFGSGLPNSFFSANDCGILLRRPRFSSSS